MASGKLDWRSGRLDRIMAVGIACRRQELTDALVSLKYANVAAAYPAMLKAVRGMARELNYRHRWRAEQQLAGMARRVLDYWLSDKCLSCGGVGHQAVQGAPARMRRVCHVCMGTGQRAKSWRARAAARALPSSASDAERAARKKKTDRAQRSEMMHDQLLARLDLAERQVEKALQRLLVR